MDYLTGLDLGQAADHSALVVLKRTVATTLLGRPRRDHLGERQYRYKAVHLTRWPLRTPYPRIVSDITTLARRPELTLKPRLVIDATGVGRAVVDMLLNSRLIVETELLPLTITGGIDATYERYSGTMVMSYKVPKRQLSSAVQAALSGHRLSVPPRLPHADTLRKELDGFQIKLTAAANEVTGNWREGEHDDLVLALAMALWVGDRRETEMRSEQRQAEQPHAEAQAQREWRRLDNPAWWSDDGGAEQIL